MIQNNKDQYEAQSKCPVVNTYTEYDFNDERCNAKSII